MASNNAVTGSEALINLQNNLNSLSSELQRIYDLMYNQMRGLGNSWKDSKYQDFVVGFKPQIDKCKEISESYKKWSTTTLQRTIDAVLEAEKADVSAKRIRGRASHVGAVSGGGASNEEVVSGRTSHFGRTSDSDVSDNLRGNSAVGAGMAAAAGATGAAVGFDVGVNQGSRSTTNMGANLTTPSVDDYRAKFKEKGIFHIDENGNVKADNNKIINAVNNVHGNNPEVKYENLEENLNGFQKGNRITLNNTLANNPKKIAGITAHEDQHINQNESCSTRESQNDAICENLRNYKEPCNDVEKELLGPERCEEKFNDYFWQDVEVDAREAEANAEIAYDKVLHEFKREHKLEKPRRWKIK